MLSRRDLLRTLSSAGLAAFAGPLRPRSAVSQPRFSECPFTLGVASGDPLPDGIVLWTRLAPDPLNGGGVTAGAVRVRWELADDPLFRAIVRRGEADARSEFGHSVHVEIDGLRPGREYFYRFHAGADVSAVGRTKTAPPAGAAVDRVRFAVCGCNHYEHGYFTAFAHLADEAFDFIFHTGDYIYEYGRGAETELTPVRDHLGDETYTLDDYRNRYAQYRMDRHLMAAHQSAPFVASWDDHDVADNYAGDRDAYGASPAQFVLRRAAAYQAFFESMPLRRSAMPAGSELRLYRRLTFGRLVDLSVLDTRQYRSDQACGDGNHQRCAGADDRARTMLGGEQEAWLFKNLAASSATWNVIGQQVPTYTVDARSRNPDWLLSMDKWDGYSEARRRLYERLQRTPNPVILSGDVHAHFGADLKAEYLNPRSRTIGVELTNSSITTTGDGSDVQNGWDRIRTDNPHLMFHSNRRGYIACTATRSALRADFKVVDKVSIEDQSVRTAGSLIVEAGHAGAQPG